MVDKSYSTCRICLMESSRSASLYETTNSEKYCDVIKNYTGLEVLQNDNLPSAICDSCISELMIVVNFISKCRTSNERLQKALEQNIPFYHLLSDKIKEDDESLNFMCDVDIKEEACDVDDNFSDSPLFSAAHDENVKLRKKTKVKKLKRKEILKGPFKCDVCGVNTTSKSALITHNRTHTGERPYVCTECNKCFSQGSTLREHIGRVHMRSAQLSKKSCVCDYCGKQCYRKNELRVHLRIHTKEKPYKCPICPESFSQQSTLNQHVRRHKGEKPFSCHICGNLFVSQSGLKSHMMVHSGEKNYKCHICDKALKSSRALHNHLLVHADVKPNVCDQCGVAFAQKGNLKHHILVKHSERSGICDICKKTYSDLSVHMRVHTGEKPFKCQMCGKGFSRNCHLTTHLKRHREPNKFACAESECNAAFPMHCQLEFHVLKFHTKQFPFTCDGCTKGFYRLTDLKKHKNSSTCKSLSRNFDTKLPDTDSPISQ